MSVKIASGAGAGELLTVDPTSLAARMTLYDSAGVELYRIPTGAYMLAIVNGRQTVIATAAGTFFAMRNNTSGATLYIRRIVLVVGFDGTAVATTSRWELARFSAATPSGGTSISLPGGAIKKRSGYGNSNLLDARYITGTAGGLTMTSVTMQAAFDSVGVPRGATSGVATYIREFGDAGARPNDRMELATGEGLAINAGVTGVVGDSFQGSVEWDEI
jgi:hypothetical protein